MNQWAADHTRRAGRRRPDPGARHVRARVSHGLRRGGRLRTSMRSWPTSTGRRSTSAIRRPCMARASRSRRARTTWPSAQVLDVRRAGMFEKAETVIPGATLARPCRRGDLGPRRAQGQGDRGLLRVWPRSGTGDGAAAARPRREGALSARRNRRLASGRPAGRCRREPRREGAQETVMRPVLCAALWCLSASAMADTISFDADVCRPAAGGLDLRRHRPRQAQVDRRGRPERAEAARCCASPASATFPWCVKSDATRWPTAGSRSKFKPLSGQGGPGRRRRLALEGRRQLLRRARQRAREQRLALLHRARHPQDPQVRRCAGRGRPVAHAAGRVRRHQDRRLARRQALHRFRRRPHHRRRQRSASGPRPTA